MIVANLNLVPGLSPGASEKSPQPAFIKGGFFVFLDFRKRTLVNFVDFWANVLLLLGIAYLFMQ